MGVLAVALAAVVGCGGFEWDKPWALGEERQRLPLAVCADTMGQRDQAAVARGINWWNAKMGGPVFRLDCRARAVEFVGDYGASLPGEAFVEIGRATVVLGHPWLTPTFPGEGSQVTGRDVTIRHELGHVLGLGHQPSQHCLMYAGVGPASDLCDEEAEVLRTRYRISSASR